MTREEDEEVESSNASSASTRATVGSPFLQGRTLTHQGQKRLFDALNLEEGRCKRLCKLEKERANSILSVMSKTFGVKRPKGDFSCPSDMGINFQIANVYNSVPKPISGTSPSF